MSDHHDDHVPYNQTYINAWTILSVVFAGVLFLA